jgi:hypothetical protein
MKLSELIRRESRSSVILAALTLIAAVLVLLLPEGISRQVPAFLLLWILPALTWSLILTGHIIARSLLGAGLALFLNSFAVLLVSYFPGAPSPTILLIASVLISLVPIIISIVRPISQSDITVNQSTNWPLLSAILLLALALRLVNMGYKELQGDEGVIMVRAASALTGDNAELFLHQKGPMEILLPMATWSQTGMIEDFWARLPFVWAGLLVVLAIYWLGRTWFQENVGLVAALLLAVNGFGIAFGRIIQYQSIVMLFGALALMTAWRYRQQSRRIDLLLCATFTGAALLAHYDALLVVPAIAWILAGKVKNEGSINVGDWISSVLLGLAIVAVFYIPYALSPSFGKTVSYLLSDRVGTIDSSPESIGSWAEVWRMSTFYNSTWYILGLLVLIIFGLWFLLRERRQFTAVLYFAVPFLFYTFIVEDPRTHVYTFFPGAVLLAGVGTVAIWDRLRKSENQLISYSGASIFGIWLLVVAIYPYLMFVSTEPERQRTWQENKPWPNLYPVTWDEPPQYGLFGFPHQAGWRAVSDILSPDDYPYASNEEEEITNWYMAQSERTHCEDFGSFLLAANAQDEVPYNSDVVSEMTRQIEVVVKGINRLVVFGGGESDLRRVEAKLSRKWLTPDQIAPTPGRSEFKVDVVLGDIVRLIGYDLDTSEAVPGGQLVVTLHWEALAPMELNNQVFVHLYDGEMRAQDDGAPECDIMPTSRWEPGQYIADTHILDLPDELPEGNYPLWVGMYDLLTGVNLSVEGSDDGRILLQDVQIRSN